jgi:hypothetical protein
MGKMKVRWKYSRLGHVEIWDESNPTPREADIYIRAEESIDAFFNHIGLDVNEVLAEEWDYAEIEPEWWDDYAPKSEQDSLFGETIYAYTRAQALADGVFIDVTEDAKESGIKYPTAVTEALWNGYIDPNERLKSMGQSARGRLWDVLLLFAFAARSSQKGCDELLYKVNFLMDRGSKYQQETVEIKAVCGPGDDGAPVITLMLIDEN